MPADPPPSASKSGRLTMPSEDVALCRKIAHIRGPSSSASKALARYEELIAAGFESDIISEKLGWLVKERFNAE